jgi:hypothetical protein
MLYITRDTSETDAPGNTNLSRVNDVLAVLNHVHCKIAADVVHMGDQNFISLKITSSDARCRIHLTETQADEIIFTLGVAVQEMHPAAPPMTDDEMPIDTNWPC